MGENTGEINPAGNFQRTVIVQEKRVEDAKKPLNFIDRFTGTHTSGFVKSEYTGRGGGSVYTHLRSGKASMAQDWRFDQQGNVVSVYVGKALEDKWGQVRKTSELTLKRGEDGKFVVRENSTPGSLSDWEREFNTSNKRIADGKQK